MRHFTTLPSHGGATLTTSTNGDVAKLAVFAFVVVGILAGRHGVAVAIAFAVRLVLRAGARLVEAACRVRILVTCRIRRRHGAIARQTLVVLANRHLDKQIVEVKVLGGTNR